MGLLTAVEMLELVAFALLAAVSFVQWRRRGGRPAFWLAVTFGILGIVVPVGRISSPEPSGFAGWVVVRSMVVMITLFPYALYRFGQSLAAPLRRVDRVAGFGTCALVAAALVVPSVEAPPGRHLVWYLVYAAAFSVQWTFLSVVAVMRLWRSGRGQPAVARRRMHTLGAAAIVLNLALFAVVGAGGRDNQGTALVTDAGGLLSALLFLVGFMPPRWLRALWRRREVAAFHVAEDQLMAAETVDKVAATMLPHAAALVGATAAVLVEADGSIRARHGISAEQARATVYQLPLPSPADADPLLLDGLVAIAMRGGWLAVTTSVVTPVFGCEEIRLLSTLARLAGLALDRAESFDRERLGRQALAEREAQLAEAQRTAQIGSYTWDVATHEVSWSDEMARLLGFAPAEVGDKAAAFSSRIHPDDRLRVLDAWAAAPVTPTPSSTEFRIVLPTGETRWIQGRVQPTVDADGRVVRVVGTLQDLTDRKLAEQAIAFQATHDALTGLPNRVLFIDRLTHAVAGRGRHPTGIAVLFLDVDRFKWLNDSLGHTAGDEVLVAVANRLAGALRPADTLARFGGDEFVVLSEHLQSAADAEALAGRLRTALAAPIAVAGDETALTISVGIAYAPAEANGVSAESLVRDADAAMYHAKEQGRDRHALFDLDTRRISLARHETANALRRGVARGELVVHYQPQVDITSARVVGLEALVRWNHPQRGLLMPHHFIPLAEETGIIVSLGARVLTTACLQLTEWTRRSAAPESLTMSVNLAARQLLASDLAKVVADALEESGLDPTQLCLEITESVLLDDGEASARALRELKALGVRIGVDDFGTGFSGLTYLKRFPVDVLKIDRSFVAGLGKQREDRAIVASVIDLAHAFGLTTVAEGVETPDQLAELRSLGCERAQGYLWSPAMAATVAEEWLAAHRRVWSPAGIGGGSEAPAARRRLRVLLVEDDRSLRQLYRLMLEDSDDFEVVGEAEDGRKAIAAARHFLPDVIVLDLAMPGIGGLEALPLIQAVAPDAKIIVFSGLDPATYAGPVLRQGAVAYLAKDREPRELITALGSLV